MIHSRMAPPRISAVFHSIGDHGPILASSSRKKALPPTSDAWDLSVSACRSHLAEMRGLITNASSDLFTPLPHGEGQTLLREALQMADHNAYHVGEIVLLRRLLGAWK